MTTRLYYYPICPMCRMVRVALEECKIEYSLIQVKFWIKDEMFRNISPTFTIPVLERINNKQKITIVGSGAILNYINTNNKNNVNLLGDNLKKKTDILSVMDISNNIYRDSVYPILNNRVFNVFKRYVNYSKDLKQERNDMLEYLDYIDLLTEKNERITGNEMTMADIAIASQISSLDYLNEIKWDSFPNVKQWYSAIKSRPSFQSTVLKDIIPGISPSQHYKNLDF
ncbi:glutathione S-transferase family protein [Rickettsiales bacterium]|nr:glutathione S-transferase family protein [Rickettsiales bacterium]